MTRYSRSFGRVWYQYFSHDGWSGFLLLTRDKTEFRAFNIQNWVISSFSWFCFAFYLSKSCLIFVDNFMLSVQMWLFERKINRPYMENSYLDKVTIILSFWLKNLLYSNEGKRMLLRWYYVLVAKSFNVCWYLIAIIKFG